MGRQTIVSPLFRNQGKLSPVMIKKLMIRGGGIQIDDCLERMGWTPDKAVVTSIMTIDSSSGAIKGVRFESRGKGPNVRFKAKELWPSITEDVTMTIKLTDLSRLPWLGTGEKRNQTSWIGSQQVDVEAVHKERGALTDEELGEIGINGFCMRFTLLPVKVDKVLLYGSILPMSKAALEEKLFEMETTVEMESPFIPAIAMKLSLVNGKYQVGFPMDFLPVEQEGDRVGLGHLPLIECIGSGVPVLPKQADIATQLKNLLGNLQPTNNVNPQRFRSLMSGQALPQTTTGSISYEWPDYVTTVMDDVEDTPTGLSVLFTMSVSSVCKTPTVTATELSYLKVKSFFLWSQRPLGGPRN